MSRTFAIRINASSNTFESISEIFNHYPTRTQADWELALEDDSEISPNVFEYLVEVLNSNLPLLATLNITKADISLWYFYEYEGQCNMEFDTQILKRLGDLGVVFCISCWKKDDMIEF
jgi:hypothetical protein